MYPRCEWDKPNDVDLGDHSTKKYAYSQHYIHQKFAQR